MKAYQIVEREPVGDESEQEEPIPKPVKGWVGAKARYQSVSRT